MPASDAIPVPRKNTAYRFYFAIRKPSDSTLITTWAGMDSEVSKDGGAYADCTNEATEIGTTGTGFIDLTATEMNADCVLLKVTVTNSGSVPLVFAIYPEEVGDYRANAAQVGGQTASAAGTVTFPGTIASTTNITAATGVTVATNNDKTGYSLTATTGLGNQTANITGNLSGSIGSVTGAVGSVTGNVGGSVASVSGAVGSVTAAVTVGTINANVITTTSINNGAFTAAKFASDFFAGIWNTLTSGLTTVGSIGKLLVDNINATISSRSTYAGGDTSGTTTLLTRIVGTLASGTHNAQSGDAFARLGAPVGASISADIAAVQADTDNLQTRIPAALVSGRMDVSVSAMAANVLTASALATDAVTEIQAGLATSSQIPAEFTSATFASTGVFATAALANAPSGGGGGLTAAQVWDYAISGSLTPGSTGAALNAAGGAGDPWITTLPGSYIAGQAGYILDQIADKTDLITAQTVFVTVDRVNGTTINMYYNESTTATVAIDEDVTAKTLRFIVEDANGTDVLVIEDASITTTTTSFTVTITTAVTATLGQYKWALRDITGGINRLVEGGILSVSGAANKDA